VLSLVPGGAERLVIELCQRLRSDFDFAVCCLDDDGPWSGQLRKDGVPVVSLARRPGFHPALSRGIARYARHFDASVLHCHEYSPFVYGTLAQIVAPGLRVISTEHGRLSDARATIKRRIGTRLVTLLPATVFAVCAELRERLVQDGFPARLVHVIRNGVDPGAEPTRERRQAARSALSLGRDEIVLGAVGRLAGVKDFGTLVSAMSILRRPNRRTRLVIIGEGPERPTLAAQIQAEGLEDVVSLAGYRDNVSDLLPAFDVFANSSTYEGISLTILEAMAAGLPVVATRVGGNPEVVDEGVTGTLVPGRSPESMATAIELLLGDEQLRHKYGRSGRLRVIREFDINRMVAEYAEVYRGFRSA
jgi:glycosyltransferase involved in cell wall biosynthesis